MKKDQNLNLRIDPPTKAMGSVLAKSAGMSLAEWIRSLIWREYQARYTVTEAGRKALEEIKKAGE